MTDDEIANLKRGPETYTVDELATLCGAVGRSVRRSHDPSPRRDREQRHMRSAATNGFGDLQCLLVPDRVLPLRRRRLRQSRPVFRQRLHKPLVYFCPFDVSLLSQSHDVRPQLLEAAASLETA